MRGTLRRIARNSSLLMGSHILGKLLFFFTVIILTRLLGVEGFGKFNFSLSFVLIFTVFADLGVNAFMIREVARKKELAALYFRNALLLRVILGAVVYGVIVLTASLAGYPEDIAELVRLIALYGIAESFNGFISAYLRSFERMEYEAFLNVFMKTALLLSVLFAGSQGWGLAGIGLVYVAVSFMRLVFGMVIVFSRGFISPGEFLSGKTDIRFIRSMLSRAWPFAVISVLGVIYYRIDSVMLQSMKGSMAVGWYGAAHRVTGALNFIPEMFAASLYPVFSRFFIESREKLETAYPMAFEFLLILGLPLAAGVMVLSEEITLFLYGQDFLESAAALRILSWTLLAVFLSYITGTALNSLNRQKTLTKISAFCVILNIALNFILIPRYGFPGAALTTLVTSSLMLALGLFCLEKQRFSIRYFRILAGPAFAAAGMCFAVFLISGAALFLRIISGALVYAAIIAATGVVGRIRREIGSAGGLRGV